MDLTNAKWALVEPDIPMPPRRPDGRGRPWKDRRDVLNGILWVLRTGAPWHDLPPRYPSYQTCHRRFQQWLTQGVFERLMRALGEELDWQAACTLSKVTSTVPSPRRKKGALCGQDQARQRDQDHGDWRRGWASHCRGSL